MADGLGQQPIDGVIAELRETDPQLLREADLPYQHGFLSTVAAGPGDRSLALIVVLISALGVAAAIPFARVPLLQVDAFIPAYEAALILIDAITAVMLFGQFRWSRSPALLVLAAGYLYDALLIIPHMLSFPGVFASAGLLGGGQTTAWLFNFWHGGFPLFVIGYALLNARQGRRDAPASDSVDAAMVGLTVLATAALAIGLTVLATYHDTALPTLMAGNGYRPRPYLCRRRATWALGLVAIVVLWRQHRHTVLDLWLMVMLCAWVFDIALSAVFNAARFDLGFYAGCGYGLLAASFVLGVLLTETAGLHSRLGAAKALLDDYAHGLEDSQVRSAELEAGKITERQKGGWRSCTSRRKMEALGQATRWPGARLQQPPRYHHRQSRSARR